MTLKQISIYVLKLILCGLAYSVGSIIGSAAAIQFKLPLPTMPTGVDSNTVLYVHLTTPLLAFALALLARGLAGRFITRALILAFLMWMVYTVNTQLEASIFSTYALGMWFAIISAIVSSLFCGAAVAYLFPPEDPNNDFLAAIKASIARRRPAAWVWRFALAAVAFAPIYFFFGLLVTPFTLDYYRQNMFGLSLPTIDQILPILFLRSFLFLFACLPLVLAWQRTTRSLFWRLGTALFILVGFVYMLISTWLPLTVRLPHTLEILADEFVYAAVLVALLAARQSVDRQPSFLPRKAIDVK